MIRAEDVKAGIAEHKPKACTSVLPYLKSKQIHVEHALYVNDGHVQHKRRLKADRLTVGGKTKYLKNRNQTGITLSERYVAGSFFMEKGMQDAKPRLERLIESFMEQTAREIEGGRL